MNLLEYFEAITAVFQFSLLQRRHWWTQSSWLSNLDRSLLLQPERELVPQWENSVSLVHGRRREFVMRVFKLCSCRKAITKYVSYYLSLWAGQVVLVPLVLNRMPFDFEVLRRIIWQGLQRVGRAIILWVRIRHSLNSIYLVNNNLRLPSHSVYKDTVLYFDGRRHWEGKALPHQ
jgi:hypothetical protein